MKEQNLNVEDLLKLHTDHIVSFRQRLFLFTLIAIKTKFVLAAKGVYLL